MQTIERNSKTVKQEKGIVERGLLALKKILDDQSNTKPEDQISKAAKSEDANKPEQENQSVKPPEEALSPEDAQYVRALEGKKQKIKQVKEISTISIEATKEQKKAKIAKASAKTLGFFETLVTAKNAYFKYLEKHHIFMVIGTISLFGAIALHELANVTILNKIFPSLSPIFKHSIATSVSVLFEALAITLVMTRYKKASYMLDAVIIGMIAWSSYYEFSVNQLDPISSLSRGVIGVSFFIGLMIIVHVIAANEAERKRQRFEHLPKQKRRELLESLKKLQKDILASAKIETKEKEKLNKKTGVKETKLEEFTVYDSKIRYNWLATCSAYNIKSGSLKKVCVRIGIYSKPFFAQLPTEKKIKKSKKGNNFVLEYKKPMEETTSTKIKKKGDKVQEEYKAEVKNSQ